MPGKLIKIRVFAYNGVSIELSEDFEVKKFDKFLCEQTWEKDGLPRALSPWTFEDQEYKVVGYVDRGTFLEDGDRIRMLVEQK